MQANQRLWRTGDGRLVGDGDPAAATLAYAPGDDIAAADEAAVPEDRRPAETPAEKAAPRPADKSRRPAGNKRS